MNFTLTKEEQKSILDAYQYNNAASVGMVKIRLKQMISIIKSGSNIEIPSNDEIISSISDLETWVRSFLNVELKTFIDN